MSLAIKRARAASQGGLSGDVHAGGFLTDLLGRAAGTLPVIGPAITTGIGIARRIRGGGGIKKPGIPTLGIPAFTPGEPTVLGEQRFAARQRASAPVATNGRVGVACPSGFHPNKSSYFTLQGFVPKGSRCVKNRRRNPMNPRALDRAIRRVDAGKSLQGKLAEITTAKWTSSGKKKDGC